MKTPKRKVVVGLSGGPDSVFLLMKMHSGGADVVAAHLNHSTRGRESEADQRFVERLGEMLGIPVVCRKVPRGPAKRDRPGTGTRGTPLSEALMRKARYRFLESVRVDAGADSTLVAHTADDQVETILMRVIEGAGIAGLKGIPRKTNERVERPILDVWREDILKYLKKNKISYRVDQSNFDTRFERNWIRHVLIPLLEKRYGKSVKKRIFALGERFREIDRFLETAARKWIARNVREERTGGRGKEGKAGGKGTDQETSTFVFRRLPYGKLPSGLRIRILQILSFEKANVAPNERLLASMDRLILKGGVSARLNLGRGAALQCRYDEAAWKISPDRGTVPGKPSGRPAGGIPMEGPGSYSLVEILNRFAGTSPDKIAWEERGHVTPARLRTLCKGERAAAFDATFLERPLSVRSLRTGDRIRPFGMEAGKKVKEILIDRKIPREQRWGRPVVCDAAGRILWIPGVIRSAHAPVTPGTRRTVVLHGKGQE